MKNSDTPRHTNCANSDDGNNNAAEPGTKDTSDKNNAGRDLSMDNSRISDNFGNHISKEC